MEKYYYLVVPGGTPIKLVCILATSDNLVKQYFWRIIDLGLSAPLF